MKTIYLCSFSVSLALLLMAEVCLSDSFPQLLGVLKTDTVNTRFGTRILPIGDQDSDGFDDILIWQWYRNSLFYGGAPFDSLSALEFNNTNGRNNCLGDINDDSIPDFIAQGRSAYAWKLNLYFGGSAIDTVRDLWFGSDTLRAIGYTVRGDDINENGTDEIISWERINQKSVVFFELGSDSDSIPDFELFASNDTLVNSRFGQGIASGDFNGDGRLDLAVAYNPNFNDFVNGSVYIYWGGPAFDTLPDLIITRPGTYMTGSYNFGALLENLGDVNGDTYDDLFASSGGAVFDTIGFIYFGGPTIDTIPDVIIPTLHRNARAAGDVNNDGYQDLIVSTWTTFSFIGWVEIFLGGLQMDSIPDVRFDVRDEPKQHTFYGLDCSGIGDFNGDGIDDFAFSAALGLKEFIVYVYSGWDSGTDLEIEYEYNIPSDYMLSQNYPNPFNSSTMIEFMLPRRSYTVITIYNILGQSIQTLFEKELSAGTYKVTWNGKDQIGNDVPSGIYLYDLTTEEQRISKKMILLK